MTDFCNRWNPPFVQAKQPIQNGALGKPVMIYARLSNSITVPLETYSWSSKSGLEWYLFPHIIDIVRWLIGQDARRVFAVGKKGVLRNRGIDVYDAIQAQVQFDDAFVTFETAWTLPRSWPSSIDFKVNLLGSDGQISIEADRECIDVSGKKFTFPFILGWQNAHGKMIGFFKEAIVHFIDCVDKGKEPVISPEDGVAVTKIVEAILKSIQEENPVEL